MLKGLSVVTLIGAYCIYYFINNGLPRQKSPVVNTTFGSVQGIESYTRDGKTIYKYLGIPYAASPEGNLRFETPQKPTKWEGVRDASKFGSECAQYSILHRGPVGSENCLFVNIFTPKLDTNNVKLPVAVYIHGGAFTFGSANMYNPDYLLEEDVIVVTLNYRLGSLGFLNTGDLIKGNMGLKDQNLALKFVKENIQAFGGDPSRITLFGESAGGASVHYHILSKSSKGLFHRAIAQSGLATSRWAFKENPLEQARRFANNVKCPTVSTQKIVNCLKNIGLNDLLAGHAETSEVPQHPDSMLGPSVETVVDDETFLPQTPIEIIQNGLANQVPFITGYNSHEGLLITPTVYKNSTVIEMLNNNFEEVMPELLLYQSENKKKLRSDMRKVREYYFGQAKYINSSDQFDKLADIITDFSWALPMEIAAKHSEKAPTYMYYYSYKGEFTLTKLIEALHGSYHPAIEILLQKVNKLYHRYISGKEISHPGSSHADELALMFYLEGIASYISKGSKDYDMSKKMVKLWTSFMKDEKMQFGGHDWMPVNAKSKTVRYLQIDTTTGMIDPPFPERLRIWKDLGY